LGICAERLRSFFIYGNYQTGESPVSHKTERLQLIRERHRKVILEPRRRVQLEVSDDWNDDFDFVDEELLTRELRHANDEE
jgi:hypothetical protein